jgi:hypothetical protein
MQSIDGVVPFGTGNGGGKIKKNIVLVNHKKVLNTNSGEKVNRKTNWEYNILCSVETMVRLCMVDVFNVARFNHK